MAAIIVNEDDQVRHYVKMSVPTIAPVQFLGEYVIHYGVGRGIGYAWVMRFVVHENCESVQGLHRSQTRIMEITRNLPAPWEVESLYYPSGSTAPKFSVRTTMTESSSGHRECRCVYEPRA